VELLRQQSRTNNFNHQKRLDKGQLLGRLVLFWGLALYCRNNILDSLPTNLKLSAEIDGPCSYTKTQGHSLL
jgi:hypothetical protein